MIKPNLKDIKMYNYSKYCFYFFVVFSIFNSMAFSQDADEIIRKAYENPNNLSKYAEMSIHIIRPKWEKVYEMKICTWGADYSLVLITNPVKERGQTFLKNKDQLWIWNPTLNKPIKMSKSLLSEGWMNSDLSNNELLNEKSILTDYDKKIINYETLQNLETYVIELIPKPDKNIVWGKLILWISKKNYNVLKIDFFDEDMKLVKIYIASEIKNISGRNIPMRYEIINISAKNQKTIVEINKIVFDVKINEDFFTIQNMQKGMDIVFPVK